MTTTISRLLQLSAIKSVRRASKVIFGKYLLATNIGISVSLSGTGDILQQHYDIIRQKANSWDQNRTRNMSLSGATVGAICHYWYIWLDKKLPGRTCKIVLKKVFIDQVCFSPAIISVFFITMGVLERSTLETVKQEIIQKGSQFYLAEWMIWPPAQIFNFYVLPTRFRVLYDNVISLGFDVYMSYLKNTVELKDDKQTTNGH